MDGERRPDKTMTTLDDTVASRYARHGFALVPSLLAASDIEVIRARIMDIAAGRLPTFPEANVEFEPEPDETGKPVVRKINQCAEHDDIFMALARDERILDIVESLIGPDIKLFGSQCFMKPAGGVEKPYHQDSAYFTIEPRSLVTCWIALDDVTLESGCVWVIPGSHQGELFDHSEPWRVGDRVDMQVPADKIDLDQETPITMSAGSCSFHHSKLLHRSGPNHTRRPRRGLAIHYMSSQSRWTNPARPQPDYALLRGDEYDGCV